MMMGKKNRLRREPFFGEDTQEGKEAIALGGIAGPGIDDEQLAAAEQIAVGVRGRRQRRRAQRKDPNPPLKLDALGDVISNARWIAQPSGHLLRRSTFAEHPQRMSRAHPPALGVLARPELRQLPTRQLEQEEARIEAERQKWRSNPAAGI